MTTTTSESLLNYLIELRRRLIYSISVFIFIFAFLLYYSNSLYSLLAAPLLKFLPHGLGLIATNITSPFFVPLELSFVTALLLTMPFLLFQLWAFISPALYKHERKIVWPLILISIALFYLGITFAYCVVFPLFFHFIAMSTPSGVSMAPDINLYLDFALRMLLIFGFIFEVPILLVAGVMLRLFSIHMLIHVRSYVIVGAFIFGMLIGPPEVLSQILIAVPLCLLYEIGIILAKLCSD